MQDESTEKIFFDLVHGSKIAFMYTATIINYNLAINTNIY